MRAADLQAALGRARDGLPPADPGPGRGAVARRVRRHRLERVGALTLVVVLVLGLAWVVVAAGGDRSDEGELHTDPATLPLLLPRDLPPGVALSGITDTSDPARSTGVVHEVAWTDSTGDVPIGDETVVSVMIIPSGSSQPPPDWDGPLVMGEDTSWFFAQPAEGHEVVLSSYGLDRSEAEHVFRSVALDGDGLPAASLPDGFREVHRRSRPAAVGSPTVTTQLGYVEELFVAAGGRNGVGIVEAVTVAAAPPSAIWLLGAGAPLQPTADVRGHPAFAFHADDGAGLGLVWWEAPGVMVVVTISTTEEDARRVAEGLREVSPAEWEAHLVRPGPGTTMVGPP